MPLNRTLLGAAAFSLALAGGGIAGAALGTPTLSSAQDEPTTETAEAPQRGPGEHRGERLAAAAEALGVTTDELRAALEDGQSLAQIAEAEGVDVQAVVDALVADGTERLEEAIASLPDRMADLVEREGLPHRGGPGGHGRPGGDRPAEASADAS